MVTHSLPIPIAYPKDDWRPARFKLAPRPQAADTFMKAMLELPRNTSTGILSNGFVLYCFMPL